MKLPNAVESEKVLLNKLLKKDKDALEGLIDYEKDIFFDLTNQVVFEKILSDIHSATDYDLLSIYTFLENDKHLKDAGGMSYLNSIHKDYDYSFKTHFDIVREKFFLRKKMEISANICAYISSEKPDAKKQIEKFEFELFELNRKFDSNKGNLELADKISDAALLRLDQVMNSTTKYLGLPSGFEDLDEMLQGFQATDLNIVAARSSAGKTSLYGSAIDNLIVSGNKAHILVFSLEMSKEQLIYRLISSIGHIPLQNIRKGRMTDDQWARALYALDVIKSSNLYIDDTPGLNILQIQAKITSHIMKYGQVGLVVVDYLQLLSPVKSSDSRAVDVGEMSRGLKLIAKNLNVSMLALSQLSRKPDSRLDHKPILSDLKESSSLEQDADSVIFIYREELYAPTIENRCVAEIIVAKQRNGPIGSVFVAFIKEFTKFMNVKF